MVDPVGCMVPGSLAPCVATRSVVPRHHQAKDRIVLGQGTHASVTGRAVALLYLRRPGLTQRHQTRHDVRASSPQAQARCAAHQSRPVSRRASYLCARLTIQRCRSALLTSHLAPCSGLLSHATDRGMVRDSLGMRVRGSLSRRGLRLARPCVNMLSRSRDSRCSLAALSQARVPLGGGACKASRLQAGSSALGVGRSPLLARSSRL